MLLHVMVLVLGVEQKELQEMKLPVILFIPALILFIVQARVALCLTL